MSYDLVHYENRVGILIARYGNLYSSTIDAGLAWTEPVALFPADAIAVAPQSRGAILATAARVDWTSRAFVHHSEPLRRRGARR